MKALITGASSGIGRDMARVLAKAKVDLILVARRKERLMELKKELPVHVTVVVLDVSKRENCEALYQRFVHEPIDILINNAGFGDYGEFHETELDKDLQIDVYKRQVDGHAMDEILSALSKARENKGRPTAIIANTVKGKGVSFMENQAGWHGTAPNKEQYEQAIKELGGEA